MELQEIKNKIDIIKNTKDIENLEDVLSYGDLGFKIIEVLNAVKNLSLGNVVNCPACQSENKKKSLLVKYNYFCNDCGKGYL